MRRHDDDHGRRGQCASSSMARRSAAGATATLIITDDGREVAEADADLSRPGHAVQDPRRAPHLSQPHRGVRGPGPARAVVLLQAADHAQRPPARGPPPARHAVSQLRGRAGGGHRPPHEGRRRSTTRSTTSPATPRPTTSACTTSATPTAARCCASRARTAFCPIGPELVPAAEFDPDRLHPAHLPQRRGRPGGHRRGPDLAASPTSWPTCAG